MLTIINIGSVEPNLDGVVFAYDYWLYQNFLLNRSGNRSGQGIDNIVVSIFDPGMHELLYGIQNWCPCISIVVEA